MSKDSVGPVLHLYAAKIIGHIFIVTTNWTVAGCQTGSAEGGQGHAKVPSG